MTSTNANNADRGALPYINTSIRSGGNHQRMSSSTSIPENANGVEMASSPTPSASSKTAAFFGANGNLVRPTSRSISSGSPSYASPSKDRYRELEEGSTSSTDLYRNNSWRDSLRGTHLKWDNFEGKPITPLPSPNIMEEGQGSRKGNSIFDFDFSQKETPTIASEYRDQSMKDHQASGGSSRDRQVAPFSTSNSDSFSSLPSLPSLDGFQNGTILSEVPQLTSSSSSSSKTSSFFGTNRSSLPATRMSSEELSSNLEGSSSSTASSPPHSTARYPSTVSKLYEPSRLPSMPLEQGLITGAFITSSSSSSSAASTPTPKTLKLFNQLPPFAETDLGAATPTTTIVPSPPLAEAENYDRRPSVTSSTTSSSHLASPPFSPISNGIHSRHAHGPSENASGSSLLPSLQAMHQSKDLHNGEKSSSNQQRNDQASSNLSEESEDEEEGRIGRYQIERILGVGAFSRVALASERWMSKSSQRSRKEKARSGGFVALKILEREPCLQNERMRVSWVREVEVLKHIIHPNIVRFLSSFSTPKHHNLVLEQVAGGELFELLSNHHPRLAQREWLVRLLFGELANAVGWMHSINLVHRDIKLENILLTHQLFSGDLDSLRPSSLRPSPLLKISDFGLSRFVDPSSPLLETRCGSEEYAAPELIIGKRYDGRKTDVWAMGVVLYALLSGSLPFLGQESQSQYRQQQGFKKGYSSEKGIAEDSALARKAHLLRIAKGDLQWPSQTNESSQDQVTESSSSSCPPNHRLITPTARRLVARLLRRDANKRATAWEAWDEAWLMSGSIANESSAGSEVVAAPLDPRSEAGQAWLKRNATVRSGASNLTRDD
ncbi:hypothetical protein CBS101457_002002 [Exobasidium rhododendri]|nr:hypothetical protein CBS101457_002002 [Exobasidium rhododendri]